MNTYKEALFFYNKGEYEKALDILPLKGDDISDDERHLIEECKRQITDQYAYLIKESIKQKDYSYAEILKNEYRTKFGGNLEIENFIIPQGTETINSTKQGQSSSEIPKTEEANKKHLQLLIAILVILLLIVLFVLIKNCNGNDSHLQTNLGAQTESTYVEDKVATSNISPTNTQKIEKNKTDQIIRQLKNKYGQGQVSLLFQCSGDTPYSFIEITTEDYERSLYIYNISNEDLSELKLGSIRTNTGEEIFIYSINKVLKSTNRNCFFIIYNNGANSIYYREYLIKLNIFNYDILSIASGREITVEGNRIKVTEAHLVREGSCNAENEYVYTDTYYNLNGKLIKNKPTKASSNWATFRGKIDNRYAIVMNITNNNGIIGGSYYYVKNGSNHTLTLKGKLYDDGKMVLYEFNDKGEQTGLFDGHCNSNNFYGTFTNYKKIEMPFSLYLE